MSTERSPQVILSLRQRLEIIQKLESGFPINQLANDYGVSGVTVRRIKKNAPQIRERLEMPGAEGRKKLRRPILEELDTRLFEWFVEQQTLGTYVSDAVLQEVSKRLNEELGGPTSFSASKGWIWRFKNRHGIRLIKSPIEDVEVDPRAAEEFVTQTFLRRVKNENVNLHNVYSIEETGLLWKALPPGMLAYSKGKIYRHNLSTDRVTLGLCANATGTHKLPPLFIQKYEKPKALKHCGDRLSVTLKMQGNASMDRNVLIDWLENHFKPAVKKQQLLSGIYGKVLLLIGDCEAHSLPPEARKKDGIEVIFLPANVASILQPIDQEIMKKVKRSYRHRVLRRISNYPSGMSEFFADYDLKDCADLANEAWMEVTPIDIRNSWKKLAREKAGEEEEVHAYHPYDMADVTGIKETIGNIAGRPVLRESVEEWLFTCEGLEDKADNVKHEEYLNWRPPEMYNEGIERMFANLVLWSKNVPDFINFYGPMLKNYHDLRQE